LNKWLKDNPLGQPVNGGRSEKYTLDFMAGSQKLVDFKLFQDVERQM